MKDALQKFDVRHPSILFPSTAPIEWWYYTGHTKNYGFEFCIFKLDSRIVKFFPLHKLTKKPLFVLHAAITDKANKTFTSFQQISLKNSNGKDLDIKFKNTSLKLVDGRFHLDYKNKINLVVKPIKKMVLMQPKGHLIVQEKPLHETYYVSYTQNKIRGTINGNQVIGECWMDHQKSNIPKKTDIKGWDWFGISINKTQIMIYNLKGGGKGASIIDPKGKTTYTKNVDIQTLSTYQSKKTKIVYPMNWNIKLLDYNLHIIPYVLEQEMNTLKTTPTTYYEGACKVTGTKKGTKISGNAYVELVGYDNRFIPRIARRILS